MLTSILEPFMIRFILNFDSNQLSHVWTDFTPVIRGTSYHILIALSMLLYSSNDRSEALLSIVIHFNEL